MLQTASGLTCMNQSAYHRHTTGLTKGNSSRSSWWSYFLTERSSFTPTELLLAKWSSKSTLWRFWRSVERDSILKGQSAFSRTNSPVHSFILVINNKDGHWNCSLPAPQSRLCSLCCLVVFQTEREDEGEAVTRVLDPFTLEGIHGAFMKWLECNKARGP